MSNLRRAASYFRPDAPRIAVLVVLLLLSICFGLLRPWPLALLVDCLLGSHSFPEFLKPFFPGQDKAREGLFLALGALLFHVLQALLGGWQNYLGIGISLRGLSRVRVDLLGCLQRLSWRYHQRVASGDLIYRASWDTYAFQTLFQQGFVTLLTALVSLGLMVIIMLQVDIRLTCVALSAAPLLLIVIRKFGPRMIKRGQAAQEADSVVSSRVQQTIHLLPLIQSYTQESRQESVFSRLVKSAERARLSQHGAELLYSGAVAVVFALVTSLILWLGSGQVLSGKLSVGQLLIFLAYLTQLYEPLNQLSHVGSTLATAGAGAQRVFEVLDEPQDVPDPVSPSALPAAPPTGHPGWPGRVEFENVSFAYRGGQEVLKNLNFQVEPGEVVAVIGPSGAGKSTLLHLLPRFFDPTHGVIRFGGIDLRSLRRQELRREVALVLQEPLLLAGTVRENIAFGRPDATPEEVEQAAQAANASDFIRRLPQGYDTVIGEGAARLSVGEKQRINLARAFLKDAPILLLDEPTSALDRESEQLVVDSLRLLVRGRTTFMVAHRLATLQAASKILVLQEGRVIQFGRPDELRQEDGYFARMHG